MLGPTSSLVHRRGPVLWFRKAVPADLIDRLGRSDIRSLRTCNVRVARRRAWALTLVVEDAFAVLRDAGLSPGARNALSAVLDSVMNDLDRTGQQWSQRLRYKALLESFDTRPSDDALKAEASSDELIGQLAIPTNLPVPQPSPAAPLADQSSTDLAQTVMRAIRLASLHPDANKPLTNFLPEYLAGLRRKGRGEQYLSEIGTKVQMPFDAIKHLKTDDPVKAIALNKERAQPMPPISPTDQLQAGRAIAGVHAAVRVRFPHAAWSHVHRSAALRLRRRPVSLHPQDRAAAQVLRRAPHPSS